MWSSAHKVYNVSLEKPKVIMHIIVHFLNYVKSEIARGKKHVIPFMPHDSACALICTAF